MATPVFAGYLIKEIDQTRCPKEYNLSEGEEGNSYTVYVLLESFKTKETDIWVLPTNADLELRQFWSEFFKEHVRRTIESDTDLPFSDVKYSDSEDGGVLAIHGTTLQKIKGDQLDAFRNGWASCLEKLLYYSNNAMKEELNRRDRFRANATEIGFQKNHQIGR